MYCATVVSTSALKSVTLAGKTNLVPSTLAPFVAVITAAPDL